MDRMVRVISSTAVREPAHEASLQFEQAYLRIKQLLKEANEAKQQGDSRKAEELLIAAWKLTIKDIETKKP